MRRCTRPSGSLLTARVQMRRRIEITAAVAIVAGLFHAAPVAQERIDRAMVDAIKAEGLATVAWHAASRDQSIPRRRP